MVDQSTKENVNLPETTNENLTSPGEFKVAKTSYWKSEIENNDLLVVYKRTGVVTKTINKQISLMFKNGWDSDDDIALKISNNNNFNEFAKYAYLNALISGWSLIYVEYGDTEMNGVGLDNPAPENRPAIGYYVITRAWVKEDKYYDQEIRDYYTIYKSDGSSYHIHESRLIRVSSNKDEIGMIIPAYNSIEVLDNCMWGMGQTMFRSGSGFPVMELQDAEKIINLPNGESLTRIQYYKRINFLGDMNTQTGMLYDAKDEFKFVGAEGKAISPGEYYDRAFQQVAVDLDVPVDILKGVSSGKVTGSETNLKEYYGELASKQIQQLEPIYNALFKTQQYYVDVVYLWKPIFESSPTEISENLLKDSNTIHQLEAFKYYTHEQAVNYFASNYPTLNYSQEEISSLEKEETVEIKSNTIQFDSIKTDDTSALPKGVQRVESGYMRDMTKAFNATQKTVTNLLQGYNTD